MTERQELGIIWNPPEVLEEYGEEFALRGAMHKYAVREHNRFYQVSTEEGITEWDKDIFPDPRDLSDKAQKLWKNHFVKKVKDIADENTVVILHRPPFQEKLKKRLEDEGIEVRTTEDLLPELDSNYQAIDWYAYKNGTRTGNYDLLKEQFEEVEQ